jgi:chromosome segregation ATPase
MSLGIFIGYCVLSIVVKGLDQLRGNRMQKLADMIDEIEAQKNTLTARDRSIASLQDGIRGREVTIQARDNTIASERRHRANAEAEVTRLGPFEREANDLRPTVLLLRNQIQAQHTEINRLQAFETEASDLRPQVGALRDETRNKNREIASLTADKARIQGDLEIAHQRFEVVNQRAAESQNVERNLRTFMREREEVLTRERAQHEEELDIIREKHEEEKELLQQQREEEIEAVRRNANAELDSIIITKNRE